MVRRLRFAGLFVFGTERIGTRGVVVATFQIPFMILQPSSVPREQATWEKLR